MSKVLNKFVAAFPKNKYVPLKKLPPSGGSLLVKVSLNPVLAFDLLETIYGPYEDLFKEFVFIDDKSSWERAFRTPSGILRVYDFKGSVSIGCSGKRTEVLLNEAKEFKAALEIAGKAYFEIRRRHLKDEARANPLLSFTRAFLSTSLLLKRALEKESLLEALILYAAIIDAQLRFGIILSTQLREKRVDYDTKLVHQAGKMFVPERVIHRMALGERVISKANYTRLSKLYDFRNRAVHRYFISDFEYSELRAKLTLFESLEKTLSKKLVSLERKQVKQGIGMTKKTDLELTEQLARRMMAEQHLKIDSDKIVAVLPKRKHLFPPEFDIDSDPEDGGDSGSRRAVP